MRIIYEMYTVGGRINNNIRQQRRLRATYVTHGSERNAERQGIHG